MQIFIPPPIRRSNKCDRCGQLYPKNKEHCSHCHTLNETELAELKERLALEHKALKRLGKLFLFLAVLASIATLVFAL